jgi:microcystin degradation protein MlrC
MFIVHGNKSTLRGPNVELLNSIKELEADPTVLGASFFLTQVWLDVPEIASTAVVITAGDVDAAQEYANQLGRLMWAKRHEYVVQLPSAKEAVREALQVDGGPVVLADLGDGAGGGAAGDSTSILRELLGVSRDMGGTALLTVTDPEAVALAMAKGEGAEVTMDIGGKISGEYFEPVQVTGVIQYIGKPTYKPYDVETPMGLSIVLALDEIRILITDKPVFVYAPEIYAAVGLDPLNAKIVVVKSGAQFLRYWESAAREIILVSTPGPTSSDITSMPYRRRPRPMFPWDDWDWEGRTQ